MEAFYIIVVFAAFAMGAVRGFRLGFSRQTPSVIGIAFGAVCARLLATGLVPTLYGALPDIHGHVEAGYVCDVLSTSLIFTAVYAVFATVTGFLGKVLRNGEQSILDKVGGSVFTIFKYLLFTSVCFNVLLALKPGGALLDSVKSDDGNAVEEVMLLAPAILGGENADDLRHKIQLHEARKIS